MIVSETLFALIYGFILEQRWPTVPEVVAVILMIASVLWCVRAHAPEAEPAVEGDR
jgi:drug/metabolite transporter (DMT)-like permease